MDVNMFITLEGSEGSGKTSQVPPIVKALEAAGYDVVATREPGGTPIGDQIRDVLHNLTNTDMHSRTEILLFQASRAQHVEQLILPSLKAGKIVVCDRYADASLAYQGFGRETDLEKLKYLIDYATCGLKPDLTLFLDVDVEEGLRRRAKSGGEWNRLDALKVAFYQRVREGYMTLVREEPQRWVMINANQPPESVQEQIRKVVFERLENRKTR
jgi:dTMP kinase